MKTYCKIPIKGWDEFNNFSSKKICCSFIESVRVRVSFEEKEASVLALTLFQYPKRIKVATVR